MHFVQENSDSSCTFGTSRGTSTSYSAMAWDEEGRRRLRAEMDRMKLDQTALAKRLGWTQSKVSRIASSRVKKKVPDADELLALCLVLETSADFLLGLPGNVIAKRALQETRRLVERAEADMDAAERQEEGLPVDRGGRR